MNANIMNTQILKVIEGHKSSIIKFCLSFLVTYFLLPNTFTYESILIKIYMNANIINLHIFHLDKV